MRSSRAARSLLAAFLLIAAACAPARTPAPSATSSPPASPSATPAPTGALAGLQVGLEPVADGFERPLFVTHADDGSGRLFVVEQDGRVWILQDGTRIDSPFLDISDRTNGGGERGLLGFAFHPAYPDDPRVFVDYTNLEGDTVVASLTGGLDADAIDPDTEDVIITVDQPYANHNGGAIAFDPGANLLIAMGDGGSGGDPQDRAEDPQELLGKILRLDVSRTEADRNYAIPLDNPHQDDGFRPEILHEGLRNPWRLSIDRGTGDLWIGDVGQGSLEEVDVARAGATGLHFGWDTLEGTECHEPSSGCDTDGKTMPVAEYSHDFGCTVVGGYVYRGSLHPELTGIYLYADYCSGLMWAIDAAAPGVPTLVSETNLNIGSFGEDEAGELYLADIGSGAIVRIVPGD